MLYLVPKVCTVEHPDKYDGLRISKFFLLTFLVIQIFSVDDKVHTWWREADFGFVKKIKDNLVTVCEAREQVLYDK